MNFHTSYEYLCNFDNIFLAWQRVKSGKSERKDILTFERHLEDNLLDLHSVLVSREYEHGGDQYMQVFDGKKRDIYKSGVRDKVVDQLVSRYIDRLCRADFIADTYASIPGRGLHKAVESVRYFCKLSSDGGHRPCFVLKGDVRSYFASIDHEILLDQLRLRVSDENILNLLKTIIKSFEPGLPLGNVASQILANIYLHPFDLFVKKLLRQRYYARYNDDFVVISESRDELAKVSPMIQEWLWLELKLCVPDNKITISKFCAGFEFLGYKILPQAMLLRGTTKAKVYANFSERNKTSYLGLLAHADTYNLRQKLYA